MDVDKWIEDIKYLMDLSVRDKEEDRRYRLICTQDDSDSLLYVEDLDACMCLDEIKKYGYAIDHWVSIYNDFYGVNIPVARTKKRKFFYFMTMTGKKRIVDNPRNIKLMHNFGLNIFNNNIYKRFYKVDWNVETGKHIDKSNVHIHALIIFDTTNKNFKRDFCNSFKKIFGMYDYKEDRFVMKLTDIYRDKYEYLHNKDKSVLHKNYRDTGILEHLEC